LDDSFSALVRGPSTRYPRGFPLLFPLWLAIVLAGAWIAWLRVIGPMQWWYGDTLVGGMAIASITVLGVLMTIRQPAFRADRNGIRLGLRTERKRPRHRQAHLWWSDVRQLRIEPRRYGALVEISLGPAARITRRRGVLRQALLWCAMFLLPFGLGRGTPRLTEPGRKDPQYRIRLYDVTPEELGLALAALALPAVEIIVISRRYGPIMARRPQPAAPRQPAPAAPRTAPAQPAAAQPAATVTVADAGAPPAAADEPAVAAKPAVSEPAAAQAPAAAEPSLADTIPPRSEPVLAEAAPDDPAPESPAPAPAPAPGPVLADAAPDDPLPQVPLIGTPPVDLKADDLAAEDAVAERAAAQPAA
jgi:hypothetical protein